MKLRPQTPGGRARFIAGLVLLATLAAVFVFWVLPRLQVETDLVALLPRQESDASTDKALDVFAEALSRKVVYLIGSNDENIAKQAARVFAAQLEHGGGFAAVYSEVNANLQQMAGLYAEHGPYLLSRRQETLLATGNAARIYRDALRSAYSPAGPFRPLPFAQDPLGLGADYLLAQVPASGSAQVEDSLLVARRGEQTFVMVSAEVGGSAFSVDVQEKAQQTLQRALTAAEKTARTMGGAVTFIPSGVLQHATAATSAARTEISLFGAIDTIFVLGLMLALFRSWRAPALGVLALASGATSGMVAAYFIFGQVHLIALVFGTSLIGVAIDYAMHFFSDQFRSPRDWQAPQALEHVARPILLGLAVALLGYMGLLLLPFPGLKQMAVISIAGLIVACACVLLIFPQWARGSGRELPLWCAQFLDWLKFVAGQLRRRNVGLTVGLIAITVVGVGLSRVRSEDNVRSLQAGDRNLLQSERRVQEILETAAERRFFVVRGADAQAVLEIEERLTGALDELIAQHRLDGYNAVSRSLPSIARQRKTYALLEQQVYAPDGILPRFMRELGYDALAIEKSVKTFNAAAQPLTPQAWTASAASQAYRHLWLGGIGSEHATVVTLEGIKDPAALLSLSGRLPGVKFIDRVTDISAVLAKYRQTVLLLLLAIYVVLCFALTLRYGWSDALRLLLAPAGATALTLAFAGWIGLPLTLFVALALLLLLGLGVDYAIFLREAASEWRTALLAVTLSALTTMISFGLLSFSSTPLISAIGITLGVGIASCWLLAVVGHALSPAPSALGKA